MADLAPAPAPPTTSAIFRSEYRDRLAIATNGRTIRAGARAANRLGVAMSHREVQFIDPQGRMGLEMRPLKMAAKS
jgi:hypothetical protein